MRMPGNQEPMNSGTVAPSRTGHALVLGGLDIAEPIHDAGLPVTMMRPRAEPSRFSRARIPWVEQSNPEELVGGLREAARRLDDPVVLYVGDDQMLQFASHHRDELRPELTFLMPDAGVVDALLDKGQFQELAVRQGLPVPAGEVVSTTDDVDAATTPELPVLIKPLLWNAQRLETDFGASKAVVATSRQELRAALNRVAHSYERVLVQTFVVGPETGVESYHVYVDPEGRIAAEFTGRKIRTSPAAFGQSTALTTTDAGDVAELGRRVVRAVGVQGVAKVDFKRDPSGALWLFEVNVRFNLWHRLGAVAGCNIPALVFADLTGRPRPEFTRGLPGLTWSRQPRDLMIAREHGIPPRKYLRWLQECDAVSGLRVSDPMPFVRGSIPIQLRAKMQSFRERGRRR